MRLIVASAAQPEKVLGHVVSSLRAEGHVVGMYPRAHGAALAQLPEVEQAEALERVRILYALLFRVRWHDMQSRSVLGPG